MADSQIRIHLNPGPWSHPECQYCYTAQGKMSGHVSIESDKKLHSSWLEVSAVWRTQGNGIKDSETVWSDSFRVTDFHGGATTVPFQLTLPRGPGTVYGPNIQIIWEITAQLKLAWKIDPKDTRTFFLVVS